MRYGNFKDRAKEWLTTHKRLLLRTAAAAGAVALVVVLILNASPTQSYDDVLRRVERSMADMSGQIAGLTTTVNRVSGNLEDAIDDFTEVVRSAGGEVEGLGDATGQLIIMLGQMQDKLELLADGPPRAWLTGTFGSHTLHAKSNQAGNFTGIIYLGYDSPVALNATSHGAAMDEFAAGLDEPTHAYVPTLSFNGTAWHVTSVHFNVGTFTLEAKTEKAIEVVAGGIHEDFAPDWAYVEIWPVWRENS